MPNMNSEFVTIAPAMEAFTSVYWPACKAVIAITSPGARDGSPRASDGAARASNRDLGEERTQGAKRSQGSRRNAASACEESISSAATRCARAAWESAGASRQRSAILSRSSTRPTRSFSVAK